MAPDHIFIFILIYLLFPLSGVYILSLSEMSKCLWTMSMDKCLWTMSMDNVYGQCLWTWTMSMDMSMDNVYGHGHYGCLSFFFYSLTC